MVARQGGALLPFPAQPEMASGGEIASNCLVALSEQSRAVEAVG